MIVGHCEHVCRQNFLQRIRVNKTISDWPNQTTMSLTDRSIVHKYMPVHIVTHSIFLSNQMIIKWAQFYLFHGWDEFRHCFVSLSRQQRYPFPFPRSLEHFFEPLGWCSCYTQHRENLHVEKRKEICESLLYTRTHVFLLLDVFHFFLFISSSCKTIFTTTSFLYEQGHFDGLAD